MCFKYNEQIQKDLTFWVSASHKNTQKMNKIVKMMILAVLFFAGSQMFAQTDFYLNLGGSIPVGDFAEGDEHGFGLVTKSTKGGAGIGFTAGMKLKFNTGVKGLGVILTLDGIYNGHNSDVKEYFEDIEEEWLEDDDWDVTMKTPKYLNVPLMVGVNYTYNFNEKIGIYGEAGLGANFRYITKYELKEEEDYYGDTYEYSEVIKYDPAFTFAYQLGAGIEIINRITVGVSFYGLGNGKVKGKSEWEEVYDYESYSDSERFNLKSVAPNMVMLRIGFKF